jgi:hypothetical protein
MVHINCVATNAGLRKGWTAGHDRVVDAIACKLLPSMRCLGQRHQQDWKHADCVVAGGDFACEGYCSSNFGTTRLKHLFDVRIACLVTANNVGR